jgi:hypothetical protein
MYVMDRLGVKLDGWTEQRQMTATLIRSMYVQYIVRE